jgi:hypothetical protein
MENVTPNITPLNITQLELGKAYFNVGVDMERKMSLRTAFRFVKISYCLEGGSFTQKIGAEQLDGFPEPYTWDARGFSAENMGLLVGTKYPSQFEDNHWRTFVYSPETWRFFQKIVSDQNMTQYESIVGKREPRTEEQKSQRFKPRDRIEAMQEMLS